MIWAMQLLILILYPPKPIEAHNHNRIVLDINGNDLQSGVDYYVLSANWGSGGGGGLSFAGRNSTFSLYVMQHRDDMKQGKPLRFAPASSACEEIIGRRFSRASTTKERIVEAMPRHHGSPIYESIDLNVGFSGTPTVWRIGEADDKSGRRYVTVGGGAGHPGYLTVNNWFRIERHGPYGYKIVHCPRVCESCKTECGDVGIVDEDGKRWLSLSKHPLWVMFMRADRAYLDGLE